MKCNHCLKEFSENLVEKERQLYPDRNGIQFVIKSYLCPDCGKNNIFLEQYSSVIGGLKLIDKKMVFPY